MFTTIEDIARNAIGRFSREDREWFSTMLLDDMQHGHHHLGRWIRNTYGLWYDNPLTEKWRTDKASHDMRDGVDFSADHPDNLSADIIARIWELLRK